MKINWTHLRRKLILIFRFKRLKIVEQNLIVLLVAVIIPMTIGGIVISNINQKVVRSQLRDNASLIAGMVSTEIDFFANTVVKNLEQIKAALSYMKNKEDQYLYLHSISETAFGREKLEILYSKYEVDLLATKNRESGRSTLYIPLDKERFLVATYNLDNLDDELFKALANDKRQIYVLGNNFNLIASHNFDNEVFEESYNILPKGKINAKYETPVVFGKIKNEPLVYIKKRSPEITIIVNTPKTLTDSTISKSRFKIISMILLVALCIIGLGGLHSYYLYINIRQLFKGIMAIAKGNYKRQIRLITSPFTPYEIVFLAQEFNKMAHQLQKTYIELDKSNKELNDMNEFRKNLIDTVSHELRTPLTSIQGYTSRLLRQDIIIDKETQQKSLRIIREQSERLKHLIEDLLTVPDIEQFRLRTAIDKVWLRDIMESAKTLVKHKERNDIIINMAEDFPQVSADKERLVQVFVNLFENAMKYSEELTSIIVEGVVEDNVPTIRVRNKCEVIPEHKLVHLFDKFIRLDDNTTRTTRGTGLGLFIVKALVEAMNGEISLSSDEEWGFTVEIKFKLSEQVEAENAARV